MHSCRSVTSSARAYFAGIDMRRNTDVSNLFQRIMFLQQRIRDEIGPLPMVKYLYRFTFDSIRSERYPTVLNEETMSFEFSEDRILLPV